MRHILSYFVSTEDATMYAVTWDGYLASSLIRNTGGTEFFRDGLATVRDNIVRRHAER